MISDQAMLFLIAAAMGVPSMPLAVRAVLQAAIFFLGVFVWLNQ